MARPSMSTLLERLPIRHFLGASIHAVTLDQAAQICRDAIVSRNRIMVGVVNVGKLVQMHKDVWLRNSVLGSDLIVADGLPVVWASRMLGAVGYVTKPFDPDLLRQALDHASGRLHFRPSAERSGEL